MRLVNSVNDSLLIVNADDLGATVPVNDAIFAFMDRGLVTSATVLANGPDFGDAAKRLSRYPHCSFGVHLNLSAFPPLRPTPGLAPILDAAGNMSKAQLEKVRWTPSLRRAMFIELSAQVERCLNAGMAVSHFDSHHHSHTIPWLLPVLRDLVRRFNVRRMRGTINILPNGRIVGGRLLMKKLYERLLRATTHARTPEGMTSFTDFYARLERHLGFRWRSIEIMVHPGARSPLGLYEDALLQTDWLGRLPFSARLGTYLDI